MQIDPKWRTDCKVYQQLHVSYQVQFQHPASLVVLRLLKKIGQHLCVYGPPEES